jgi:uncharacterized protein (DUF1684 family)
MKLLKYLLLIVISALFLSCSKKVNSDPAYSAELTKWHNNRIENLKKENGWLNLAGLFWLKPGENKFGSAQSNDIIFPQESPDNIGTIILKDSNTILKVNNGVEVTVAGNIVNNLILDNDMTGNPTIMANGSLKWFIIKRGDKYGIRLRNLNADLIKNFPGIETYDIDKSWRIEGSFNKFAHPEIIKVPSIIGTVEQDTVFGYLSFNRNGKNYSLVPVVEDGSYFIIFADETNGEETYGAGRFLYTSLPDSSGKVILDFNKAYNPPCAFTKYATCPLPPKENYLHLKVTAGEKKFGHEH